MTGIDALGFLAAGLVLATFCMKRLIPLRALAITSNLAFILYGYSAEIEPVLILHVILLPINLFRLQQTLLAHVPDDSRRPADDERTGPRMQRCIGTMASAACKPYLALVTADGNAALASPLRTGARAAQSRRLVTGLCFSNPAR
jgi:hypothetical protein